MKLALQFLMQFGLAPASRDSGAGGEFAQP